MDRSIVDRLFDPTFNDCRDDEEFQLAWAVQSRMAEVLQRSGKPSTPPPDRLTIRRRQLAAREADDRLREQRERNGGDVPFIEDEDDPALAAVRAEVPDGVRVDGWTADRRIL